MKKILFSIAFISTLITVNAQDCKKVDEDAVARIKEDIEYLASDGLEGREAGTKGEQLAVAYLSKRMKKIGLKPLGTDGYKQAFEFSKNVRFSKESALSINKPAFTLNDDFYPIKYSANHVEIDGRTIWVGYGIDAPEMEYTDYKKQTAAYQGKIFIMDISSPDGIHPHSAYLKYHDLDSRLDLAKAKGAIGVILVNFDETADNPSPRFKKIYSKGIPVVFVKSDMLKQMLYNKDINHPCHIRVEMEEVKSTGYNVVGFIDNKAKHTVVIGAHFDHLGYGDEGSLHRGEPAIHNGADDNASGTAALLEIATFIKSKKKKFDDNNYLFVAFSGEEKGLLGSNSFVKNTPIDTKDMNYMINMDMVGRLDENKKLAIAGVGTSPLWEPTLTEINCGGISIKASQSGVGPSDHTSFYLQDVPAIHIFTGTHEDYHKPSDDADKINYEGTAFVVAFIETIIKELGDDGKIEFTKTKDQDNESAPRFSVTLGVVPDYLFEGQGMRIDGITEGKPAFNAGLQKGDIVIQMGDINIVDMMSYMKGLSAFKKGDKTIVKVKRGEEIIETEIEF